MYNVLIAIIIVIGFIAAEVIALRFIKTDAQSKKDAGNPGETEALRVELAEIKGQVSKLELAIGLKSLKKQ